MDDGDRPAKIEELRFAKKQQWSIAAYAVTLLAAVFGIAQTIKPSVGERIMATVLVALIVFFASSFLWKLQSHLKTTRQSLDPKDAKSWYRGVDVLGVLMGTVIVSGAAVAYALWFHPPQ